MIIILPNRSCTIAYTHAANASTSQGHSASRREGGGKEVLALARKLDAASPEVLMCSTEQYGTVNSMTVKWSTIQNSIEEYGTAQQSTLQYSIVKHSTV